MTIKILCPHCEQRIAAPEEEVGKVVECPTCHRSFEAVAIQPPPEAPAPAETAAEAPAPQSPPAAPPHPTPAPRLHRPVIAYRPPKSGAGTAIAIACALAVVAGGLYWWQTKGPGFPKESGAPAAGAKGENSAASAQPPPARGGAANSAGTEGIDPQRFQGVWRGTIPRTVVYKPYDITLTITYNDRGEGFTKFETPEGESEFRGAALATIFQSGGKDKVVLLREWDVSLSPDNKTMIWSEVNGPAQVKFIRQ